MLTHIAVIRLFFSDFITYYYCPINVWNVYTIFSFGIGLSHW